jgi:hypothetical protein
VSNLIKFPGRSRPQSLPPRDELAELELEFVRARLCQLRSETRYFNALMFAHCIRKAVFWVFWLWVLSLLLK